MSNYHIDGPSGSGKSTVYEELKRRGYRVIEADEELAYYGDPKTGEPAEASPLNWIWHKDKVETELGKQNDVPVFVCGGTMNRDDFSHHFEKTFMLFIDDETLKHRLLTRTNNEFGKHPDELASQLEWNQKVVKHAREKGYILIDSTKPVNEVVDEILSYVTMDS